MVALASSLVYIYLLPLHFLFPSSKTSGVMGSTAANTHALLLFLSAIVAVTVTDTASAAGTIGINYGRVANNLPTPEQVVKLLRRNKAKNVKIYDVNHRVISAFTGTGISLTVQLSNRLLLQTAHRQSFADNWVITNILPFYPATNITTIAAGNEVISLHSQQLNNALVPAMRNLYTSLSKFNLQNSIKISSPFPFDVLAESYPPSNGKFRPELIDPLIKPLLNFLDQTSSFFMINIYPFLSYSLQPQNIPLEYALSDPAAKGTTDPNTGLHYSSLFEAQIDALYFAISALDNSSNHLGLNRHRRRLSSSSSHQINVQESGWPTRGGTSRRRLLQQTAAVIDESAATKENAAKYNGNLINRILTGKGTPWVPNNPLQVYIFSLFNENLKPGPISERNYGLFYPNGEKVYNVSITGTNWWCVAKTSVSKQKLQKGLDYACSKQGGGVDCRPINRGGECYEPNTIVAHASWAFSSYYHRTSRIGGICDFGGVATLTSDKPEFGKCKLPAAK